MESSLVLVFAAVLIGAAALQIAGKRSFSCWLLVPFPAFSVVFGLFALADAPSRLGQAAFESDVKQVAFLAVLLLLSLASALRRKWRWLFWVAWIANALVCGVLVYLALFWKVFS